MNKSVSLYCTAGSSDKVYHMQLVEQADGLFMVLAQNGPRGGTLTPRKSTPAPVTYELALKKYNSVLKEKLSSGYSEGEAGTAFAGTELEQRVTGVTPVLLNIMTAEQVEHCLADDDWTLQEKFDGDRRMVRRDDLTIGINRKGLSVALPECIVADLGLPDVPRQLLLDGELMGDVLVVFDMLDYAGVDLRAKPLSERLQVMQKLEQALQASGAKSIFVVHTEFTEKGKRALYQALKENGAEGAVFKRRDAVYEAGRPNSGGSYLKDPFTHVATFIVQAPHATKRSVTLALLDEKGEEVSMGNVTVPANAGVPPQGTLVDVKYLYAYRGGKLHIPVYKGVRTDVDAQDCTMSQLFYKPEASTSA